MSLITKESADRIRRTVQRADARDMLFLAYERSAYRMIWPLIAVAIIALNVWFAGRFMLRISDFGDAPTMTFMGVDLDVTATQAMAWATATTVIIGGKVVLIVNRAPENGGGLAWAGWAFGWMVIVGYVVFSVWTTRAETMVMLQQTEDAGVAASADLTAAQIVASRAEEASGEAAARVRRAGADVAAAQVKASDVRAAYQAYRLQIEQSTTYAARDKAWLLNATHDSGPAKPYVDAIGAADAALEAARSRMLAAENAATAAQQTAVGAHAAVGAAQTAPNSAAKALENMAAGLGMTPAELYGAWALFIALLLQFLGDAGTIVAGRNLRETLDARTRAMESAKEMVASLPPAAKATASQPPAPPPPPSSPPVPDAGPLFAVDGDMTDDLAADADAVDAARIAMQREAHSDKIAEAIAMVQTGEMQTGSFAEIKKLLKVGPTVAGVIRDAMVEAGVARVGQNNTLILVREEAA